MGELTLNMNGGNGAGKTAEAGGTVARGHSLRRAGRTLLTGTALGLLAAALPLAPQMGPTGLSPVTAAWAQEEEEDNRRGDTREARALDQDAFETYETVQVMLEEERYREAEVELREALADEDADPFAKALFYRLQAQVFNLLDRPGEAIRSLQNAIGTGELTPKELLDTRFNLGILQLGEGRIDEAIENLVYFLNNAENPNDTAYFAVASAYAQKDDWANVARYGRQAIDRSSQPKESQYSLTASALIQLGNWREVRPLLETMIRIWPNKKSYWSQLGVAYQELGRNEDAYGIQVLMYEQGFLTSNSELNVVADLHNFYGNPYKAATLMDREIERGRIDATADNLEKMGNYYFAAREFREARQALIRAAQTASDGEIDLRIATTFAEEDDWGQARRYLQRALNKGGLGSDAGRAWILLGNAQMELGNRDAALTAFRNASRFDRVRSNATQWIEFIETQQQQEQAREARSIAEEASELAAEAVSAAFRAQRASEFAVDTANAVIDADPDAREAAVEEALAALEAARESFERVFVAVRVAEEKAEEARAAVTEEQSEVLEPNLRQAAERRTQAMILAEQNIDQAVDFLNVDDIDADVPEWNAQEAQERVLGGGEVIGADPDFSPNVEEEDDDLLPF